MGKRIIIFIVGLLFVLGVALSLTGCRKNPLLTEIQGIREGIGRWDEGSWDDAKFGE